MQRTVPQCHNFYSWIIHDADFLSILYMKQQNRLLNYFKFWKLFSGFNFCSFSAVDHVDSHCSYVRQWPWPQARDLDLFFFFRCWSGSNCVVCVLSLQNGCSGPYFSSRGVCYCHYLSDFLHVLQKGKEPVLINRSYSQITPGRKPKNKNTKQKHIRINEHQRGGSVIVQPNLS